ncbi:hypothetical protein BH11PAT2_BH11PAT2_05950 [soil metagenome]
MKKNTIGFAVAIVLILLIVAFLLNNHQKSNYSDTNEPTASSSTTIATDTTTRNYSDRKPDPNWNWNGWKIGQKIGDFTVASVKYYPESLHDQETGVVATFTGTTTVTGTYQLYDTNPSLFYFKVAKADVSKIPTLPFDSTETAFCVENPPLSGSKILEGTKGSATIVVANYSIKYLPRDISCWKSMNLVSIVESKS